MKRQGFTLIEFAIVLIILGLLIGVGAGLFGILIKRGKYSESKEKVKENVEGIIGYAYTWRRLPASLDEIKSAMKSLKDSYGKPIMYVFDKSLADQNINICRKSTTNLSIKVGCNDSICSSPEQKIEDVAFLIISGDGNYNIQTVKSDDIGSALNLREEDPLIVVEVNSTYTVNIYRDGAEGIDDWIKDMNRPEDYEDIVEWVSLNELKTKISCSEGRLQILNNELPYGFQNETYNAKVYAEGGVPFEDNKYEWCVEDKDGLTHINITIECESAHIVEPDCGNSGSWEQCEFVKIFGTPNSTGTFKLTFFVRDSENNTVKKSFVITINP